MSIRKDIAIAYPMADYNDGFVSRRAYENDFVGFLMDYASVVKLPFQYIEEGYQFDPDPDYLLVNIDTWGLKLFLLREQGKLDTPFLIHFHVIYGQHIYISYILPLLRKDDIVVVGSHYSKRCLLNISPLFDVPVIPLALDVEKIAGISSRAGSAGGKTIAFLGQLIQEKGIGDLLECMPKIIDNVNQPVTLNVIGPLSGRDMSNQLSPYVKQLQDRTRELGITEHVNWLGLRMDEKKYETLAQADIFVNPSVFKIETFGLAQADIFVNPSVFKIETFGVVNTEALACGLPVVCTQWSAFNEIVTEGKNGFLVDVEESEDGSYVFDRSRLIARVTELLNNDILLDKMKKEAQTSAYRYHFKELLPGLTGLLKKKEKRVEGQWEIVKEKSFLDFRRLFNPRWLKIIGADNTDYKTYHRMTTSNGPGIKFSSEAAHKIFKYLSGK